MNYVNNIIFDKTINTIKNWNTHYGMVRGYELKDCFIIEFATGGWSENESAANELNNLYSIYDKGGYYLIELNKFFLNNEQIKSLLDIGIKIKKRKIFLYKWKR